MATAKVRTRAVAAPTARGSRRAYWRALLAAHRRSGLSLAAFCHQRDLRKGTLSFWRWKFAQEAGVAAPPPPLAFVPIQLASSRSSPDAAAPVAARDGAGELEIALGPGRCVRVRGQVDAAWLGQVLRAVEALGC